ncbi:hypothetical protein ES332_A10G149900v1 [Gossypium tomentosum]|uniref:Dynein light chain n=1 Tax=Gossypium tomentosum TaxID=34277 RepID=A0A5D2NSD4_GOSTO|nr:hypothetical protein ES332_A10G149900v1 [Gossypium tomentosum]
MSTEATKRSTTGALMMKQWKTDELKPSPALTAEPKKVIIKSADMKDDMQKEAVNIAISMLVSLQLEARYSSSVVRSMTLQSRSMRKKRRIKVEKAGIWLILWTLMKKRELRVKLLRLEEHTLRLRSQDLLFWMRQESYALAFSNVLASKRKLQGNKQFKLKNGST